MLRRAEGRFWMPVNFRVRRHPGFGFGRIAGKDSFRIPLIRERLEHSLGTSTVWRLHGQMSAAGRPETGAELSALNLST